MQLIALEIALIYTILYVFFIHIFIYLLLVH